MASGPIPHVLVLAAGAGRRFGGPKQLARLGGETLLQAAVARATEVAGHAVTVVLGAHAAEVAPRLRGSTASIVVNRRWEEGLASSLRAGVAALPGSTEGVLVTLADQAAVTTFDLRRLVAQWQRQPEHIVAASHGSHVGVPAIFPALYFPALLELRGDIGARPLLHRLADRTVRVGMPSAAIDVDTPEDLARLQPAPSGGA
jgi:molybdenum cofactor cytidylyltransferase|nr:MAG: nucleotidyltransferase family protein [Pseudomonadota bacterium]